MAHFTLLNIKFTSHFRQLLSNYQIQRASEAKLLGVHTDSNLSWHTHVEAVVSKAAQRLYFLKQLKRAGVSRAQLLHFYISVIRPVLEYAVPVWHDMFPPLSSPRGRPKVSHAAEQTQL